MKINLNSFFEKMLILVLLSSTLAACSSAVLTPVATQTAEPTSTSTVAATPTNQPTVPVTPSLAATATLSPIATATPVPTATETLIPTATQTASPTPTATPPPLAAEVLKVWSFSDNTVYIANVGFTLGIYMKNTGAITWEPGYQLRFVGLTNGGDITVQPVADLTVEVRPGGKVEFDLWAFGSETLGEHTWYFQLFTANGKKVPGSECSFTFTMIHN
jgi:hypothetical protein